jgi:HK97 family phage prohead protease
MADQAVYWLPCHWAGGEVENIRFRILRRGAKLGHLLGIKNYVHFSGYASVFNVVDRGQDIIRPGAFLSSLKNRGFKGIKILWQHDPKEIVGTLDEIYEDAKGLFIKGRLLLDVSKAKEAQKLMQEEALDGLSIGFHTLKSHMREDGVRILNEVDLWEVSLVTFPMNEQARVTDFSSGAGVKNITPASYKKMAVENAAILAGLRHLTNLMRLEG